MGVKIEKDNSLTISGFEKGIEPSVLSGFSDMLGVNIDSLGVLGVGYKFNKLIETKAAVNFSIVTAGQDFLTLAVADTTLHKAAVKLSTTGTLPTGLNTTDIYYLWDINGSGLTFRFCEELNDVGGSFISLDDQGTGTHSFTRITPEEIDGYTFDSNSNLYLLDDEQRVWFSQIESGYQRFYLLEGNTSPGSGNGIVFYANHILVFGNSKIDVLDAINATTDTLTWVNDFVSGTSISSTGVYPRKGACPFYSQFDNAIYFSNGNSTTNASVVRVGLLEENVGETFNPSDADTFSIVPDAIELSNSDGRGFVQSINELGEALILGTQSNNVYFWDRKSILPYSVVNMPEQNTSAILVKAGSAYAFNGYSGKIYIVSEGTYSEQISIPEHLFDKKYTESTSFSSLLFIDFVDACISKNELLFSIEVSGKVYLMSYNTVNKTLIKKNISSYGETLTTGSTPGRIYKIIVLDRSTTLKNNILISTKKEATPDTWALECYYSVSDLKVLDDDSAYVVTGLITYGQNYSKQTLKEIQFSLTRALTTGQSVKIYYRRDDNSSWTELQSITFDTDGAIKDIKKNAPITDIIDLQIKIVINGYNSSEFGTSPFVKLIRLIP